MGTTTKNPFPPMYPPMLNSAACRRMPPQNVQYPELLKAKRGQHPNVLICPHLSPSVQSPLTKSKFRRDGRVLPIYLPSPGSIFSGDIPGHHSLRVPSLRREFADRKTLQYEVPAGRRGLKNPVQQINFSAATFQNTQCSSIAITEFSRSISQHRPRYHTVVP